jgi:hypothetical protein
MTASREIAAIYEPKLDGFVSVAPKYVRNPRSPVIVWMQRATWQLLATHATRDGEFYIPCKEGLQEPQQLQMLVLQNEMTGASNGERVESSERAAQT